MTPSAPLTDDELNKTAEAYKANGGNQSATARALGIKRQSLPHRLKQCAMRGLLGTEPVLPGFEIKQTSTLRDADGNTEREWLQTRPESGAPFALPPGHLVKGVSVLTDQDGKTRLTWHKTRLDDPTPDFVASLERVFGGYRGGAKLIKAPRTVERDLLSVYPVPDLHLGMLSWAKETGDAYDLDIAVKRAREVLGRLVGNAPASRSAVLLNLGDFQHTDDQRNITPRSGHQLDVDSRYFKILDAGVSLMIELVELLLQRHERVIVRNLPGNHDPHVAIALTIALRAWFASNKRVTVESDPSEFFWHRFGATLIGAHHGHRAKPFDLAMKMATDCRKDWGETLFHYFYCGHVHHEAAREVGDCRVEYFQTLAGKDAHAAASAYASGRSLSSIIIHKRDGEIARQRVNLAPPLAA